MNTTGNKIVWTPQKRLEWGQQQRAAYTQEWRDKVSASLKEGYASGRIKHPKLSPEAMRRMAIKLSMQRKGKRLRKTPMSDLEKARWAKFQHDNKGLGNWNEKTWRLRSPVNQVFEFRNLSHFIQTNPNLFAPEDTIIIGQKSRAMRGIQSLSPRLRKNAGSWKGWTWGPTSAVSPSGSDILQRE